MGYDHQFSTIRVFVNTVAGVGQRGMGAGSGLTEYLKQSPINLTDHEMGMDPEGCSWNARNNNKPMDEITKPCVEFVDVDIPNYNYDFKKAITLFNTKTQMWEPELLKPDRGTKKEQGWRPSSLIRVKRSEKEAVDEENKEKETVDEEKKDREEEKEPKEVEEEMEPRRNDETVIIVRPHGTESHAESDIESILVAKTAEKELLETIGMDKEIKLKGPTNTIGGPSNNAQSGKTHADSVEDTGPEALKAMDGRLMKAVEDAVKDAMKDAVKDLKKTISSLSDKLTLLEDEVKSLRSSGDNPSEENKDSDEEDDVDKALEEEDGGDKESKVFEEEDDVNNYIRDVTNEVQKEHGDVDDNMDADAAQMIGHAEKHEKAEAEKAEAEKDEKAKKKKRGGE
ncbi:unnamed protein product [Eruca vesicaria subsp. sativa]|uniref:Uncharacterized protein n=1 Tax=Eruca vesicaria subsp. sativa TaxID=29727 RepID=A0ABC8KAH8_ERUVS|nr:unnamed protein product [Eruca vesicaria subsp. sativa]